MYKRQELARSGYLDRTGIRLLACKPETIDRAEDRELFKAVSYTHLDVYKRQDKFLAGGEMHGGVAMIDVNQFKSVNDSFGHLVGDEALQTVAAAMQSCLRQTDIPVSYTHLDVYKRQR